MGLKGNLAVVNLADVFQMLSRGKSTGLLRVQAPEGMRYIELQDGSISLAGRSTPYIDLGDLLIARKAIDHAKLETALKIHKENGIAFGQVLLEMNYVAKADLEEALRFHIEEEVCDLFTLREGDFDFLASAALDTKNAPGGGAVRLKIDPDSLLLEAARRADEWNEIERRITAQAMLFRLTEDGLRVYKDADGISDEGRVIMRLLQASHTVEGIVQKSCLGRLNANLMLLELWDAHLIEPVTKDEYLWFAKHQMEAGQLQEALRIAVQASKIGTPEAIKQSFPLIDTLRKQLGTDDKTVVTPTVEKDKSTPLSRPASKQNLLIQKRSIPWIPIAAGVALLGLGVAAILYFTFPSRSRNDAMAQFDEIKTKTRTLLLDRRFFEAQKGLESYAAPPEIKKEFDQFKAATQNDIDTALIQDVNDFTQQITRDGLTPEALTYIKGRMESFKDVKVVSKDSVKELAKITRDLPVLEERLRNAGFKSRFDSLHADMENRQRSVNELTAAYRDLLKDLSPAEEAVAAKARRDLYALQQPLLETRRQLDLARDLLNKGGAETARKIADATRLKFPGSEFAADAEKLLHEIDDRNTKAEQELSKINKLVLQRKVEEARLAAKTLIESVPSPAILEATLAEIRKLNPDASESDIQFNLQRAMALWESDPQSARNQILEIVKANPYSAAVWNVSLRTQIESSPPGANVVLTTAQGERPLGKTPLVTELPVNGLIHLTMTLPNFEPLEIVRNDFRDDKLPAVFIRKPQAAVLTPYPATAGMLLLNETLVLAGGTELMVCSRRTLDVLRRADLSDKPLPVKVQDKPTQLPRLKPGELTLKALSVSSEDAEAFAFVSSSGPYFFQIPSNGVEFHRISCEPAALGAPMMYRPRMATATKLIGVASRYGVEIFTDNRKPKPGAKLALPPTDGAEQPEGFAFDGDTFYIPRSNNSVYAVEGYHGEIKFEVPCANKVSLPPAVIQRGEQIYLGIIDARGGVQIVDAATRNKEREKSRSALNASSSLGLAAAPDAFLAALDDGTLASVPLPEGKGKWTITLPGKPLLTPIVALPPKQTKESAPAAVVCCALTNGSYSLNVYRLDTGAPMWEAHLNGKPLAMTSNSEAVFVSTSDAELLRFDLVVPIQSQ